jgi:hypothetical protein
MKEEMQKLGIHIIHTLHDLTANLDAREAFALRMEFYTKMMASDIACSIDMEQLDELMQALVSSLSETCKQLQQVESVH